MFINVDRSRPDSAHYSVMALQQGVRGMDALREVFPEAEANELNFVLFSTSGVHATYNTIEDAELVIRGEASEDGFTEVSFIIVHPRLVALRYGVCNPESQDDIDFLKSLRESSHKVVMEIGRKS